MNAGRPAALLLLVCLTRTASAAEPDWLQYHAACDGREKLGEVLSLELAVSADRPEGVRLPRFAGDRPCFARWSTPMTAQGFRWIAVDRSHSYGAYDRLYADADGDGHLAGETPAEAYRIDNRSTYFGPVPVVFATDDGPVTYHLGFRFEEREEERTLSVSSACWYEGRVALEPGGEKQVCLLLDHNVNGTFDDKSLDPDACDRIRIGGREAGAGRHTGRYVEYGDTLYRLEAARDGACVALAPAGDVPSGTVEVPRDVASFTAGGEAGLFTRKPKDGRVTLPAGTYRVRSWEIARKDGDGTLWQLTGTRRGGSTSFEITTGGSAKVDCGEPIVAQLLLQPQPGMHRFQCRLQGRNGDYVELMKDAKRAPPPELRITNKDGSYEKLLSFEYG